MKLQKLIEWTKNVRRATKYTPGTMNKSNPENNLIMTFIISVFIFIMFVFLFNTRLFRKLNKNISISDGNCFVFQTNKDDEWSVLSPKQRRITEALILRLNNFLVELGVTHRYHTSQWHFNFADRSQFH